MRIYARVDKTTGRVVRLSLRPRSFPEERILGALLRLFLGNDLRAQILDEEGEVVCWFGHDDEEEED